jgi:hypothetical protein
VRFGSIRHPYLFKRSIGQSIKEWLDLRIDQPNEMLHDSSNRHHGSRTDVDCLALNVGGLGCSKKSVDDILDVDPINLTIATAKSRCFPT